MKRKNYTWLMIVWASVVLVSLSGCASQTPPLSSSVGQAVEGFSGSAPQSIPEEPEPVPSQPEKAQEPVTTEEKTLSTEDQNTEEAASTPIQPQEEPMTYTYQTETLYAQRDGNQIYGVAYIPQNVGEKLPAVIFSHGFGGSYHNGTGYAEQLAKRGYFVYCFDFCGGSYGSRSEGDVLDMSIFTEQADLEAVLAMITSREDVDSEAIFLAGASQGGAVSAITAAANPDAVRGMILLYPAFVIVDDAKARFGRVEDIPDSYNMMGMRIGRAYAEKLLDYDFYEVISDYEKDVLIIHGDADGLVPLSYSQRAVEVYPSATLEVLPGAGHGFYGEDDRRAVQLALEYLDSHKS